MTLNSVHNSGGTNPVNARNWASHLPIATEDDFRAVDVLFTDSIAKNFVRHRQCVNYDLLSQESLRAIAAVKLSNGT